MTRRTRDILWLCTTFGAPGAVLAVLALCIVWLVMLGMGGV